MSGYNHSLIYWPLRAGTAIINPVVNQFGTLGFIGTSDGLDRWIVSCFHVLCRLEGPMPAGVRERIYYSTDVSRATPIAVVDGSKADQALDCAAAITLSPNVSRDILAIGALAAPGEPRLGMRVLKSGGATGVTEGVVTEIQADRCFVESPGYPKRYELSEGGDSGALWVSASDNAPIGLHIAGNADEGPARAVVIRIDRVLETLKLKMA